MPKKGSYQDWLKQDFDRLFETIELKDSQKHFLRSRWLDQVLWMEGKATRARNWYYRLRLTTIIGGVLLPALVTWNVSGQNTDERINAFFRWMTFGLSPVVAISAAVEEFFHHGERWRHYRRTVESLKTQGWQFFELTGPYRPYQTHDQAFPAFADLVEQVIQRDVEVYASQIVQERKPEEDEGQPGT